MNKGLGPHGQRHAEAHHRSVEGRAAAPLRARASTAGAMGPLVVHHNARAARVRRKAHPRP